MQKSLTSWGRAALAVGFVTAALAAQAQPVFHGASSAATGTIPAFRAAAAAAAWPGINLRGASQAFTTTGTLALTVPSGTAANDVMIAAIGLRPSSASVTAPSGWTLIRRIDNATAPTTSLLIYQRTAAAEPASYTWTFSGLSSATGGIQAFSGVDTSNPIDVEAGQATPFSLTHATPSVTTTGANEMLVTAHTLATATTWTPPTGMTEAIDVNDGANGGGGQSIEGNYVVQAAAGATGAKSATAAGGNGSADIGATHILALRPLPSTLSVNLPAGTAANDVMIAQISVRPYTANITAPSGWTLVRRVDYTSLQTSSLAVFRKVAGSSEPSSFAFDVSGAAYAAGGIQAFYNVDTVNPIDVEAGQGTPESMTHSTPSVTTTGANEMIVTAFAFPTSTTWIPPTGMTEAIDVQYQPVGAGQGQSLEGDYVLQPAAGATGAKTATAEGNAADNTDPGTTHILALRAAPPSLAIGLPAGTVANDVMIAALGVQPSSASITPPAGWTLVRRIDNATGQSNSLAVYRKVAATGEPASYAWDVTGATYAVGGIQSFGNVDAANPIDVESGQATASGLTHATPSVTTTSTNTMLVTAHTFASSSTWTPPAGMTEGFDVQYQPVSAGQGQSMEGDYVLQASAGATGAKSATAASDADTGATAILALRSATHAPALYYIQTDHLNTPRLITDANQVTVWQWDQAEPFGNNAPNENPSGQGAFSFPLRFPGQYADTEINLAYNYFRDYDSSLGRYVESDPIGLRGGPNTFLYASARPHSLVDALGLQVIAAPAAGMVGPGGGVGGSARGALPSNSANGTGNAEVDQALGLPTAAPSSGRPTSEEAHPQDVPTNVVDYPANDCPFNPNDCPARQAALKVERSNIVAMLALGFRIGDTISRFNAKVTSHNNFCSAYPVDPI